MKEIIENIQMLFDNKEFTLVDELLKGQGLDYNVLNCSRLFTIYYRSFDIDLSDDIRISFVEHDYDVSVVNVFRTCRNNSLPNYKKHFIQLLNSLNLPNLINNYIKEDCIKSQHLELSESEAVEFILKLNNYTTCGTK